MQEPSDLSSSLRGRFRKRKSASPSSRSAALGEIGLNMTVLEYGDDIMVIDAGLMFPDAEMLGVDIVIPDFSYLLENRDAHPRHRAHPRS